MSSVARLFKKLQTWSLAAANFNGSSLTTSEKSCQLNTGLSGTYSHSLSAPGGMAVNFFLMSERFVRIIHGVVGGDGPPAPDPVGLLGPDEPGERWRPNSSASFASCFDLKMDFMHVSVTWSKTLFAGVRFRRAMYIRASSNSRNFKPCRPVGAAFQYCWMHSSSVIRSSISPVWWHSRSQDCKDIARSPSKFGFVNAS